MRNGCVGEMGEKLVEEHFTNEGYDVDRVSEWDNTLPYDLVVKKKKRILSNKPLKIQVKATRGPKNGRYVFWTRKMKGARKVAYEPGDFDLFVFVDITSSTMVAAPFSPKTCHSFSKEEWKEQSTGEK